MAKSIEIDRKKRLREEPGKGHNRWHPDIAPVIEVEAGEEGTLETRDANDLQIHAGTTAKDLEKLERTVAHPLTGPVYVKGAQPGDLLEIEYLDIVPERYGWTREQAYVLCSVAVDLRVSNVVDVPNVTVSALLPEDIFKS